MPIRRIPTHPLAAAACALLLAAGSAAAVAQTTAGRSVRPVAPVPGNAAAATANALPSPGGLRSPLISPGGITTVPPTGLPAAPADASGSGRPIPTDALPGGGNGGAFGNGSGAAPATNVLGGPGFFAGPVAAGAGPYATVDIARSFLLADTDRNRELTRAEAQRLSISPFTFEEMDRDGNGVVTRGEYEDAVRPR